MVGQARNKSKTGKGVLTNDEVREIRRRQELFDYAKDNCSPMAIAEELGISVHIVRGVFQDKLYAHVI